MSDGAAVFVGVLMALSFVAGALSYAGVFAVVCG
jgi:hypothetical protein